MNSNFAIFIIIASILTMAVYSSSMNFVSGAAKVHPGRTTVCSFSN
ncbi:MAG: hypothetical protein M3P28_04605 [Thermoproteota archaeon]|nr:hypothetical protein [Thermoproteota archaeon]